MSVPCAVQKSDTGSINVGQAERTISMAVGAAFLLCGISRLSLASILTAAAGGALLHRGLTGPCRLYDALEKSGAGAGLTVAEGHQQGRFTESAGESSPVGS